MKSVLEGIKQPKWFCLGLFILTLALYSKVVQFDFILLDDGPYVYKNPHLRNGLTWKSIQWAFTAGFFEPSTLHCDYWQPVTILSRLVDIELFGMRAGWHHAVNALFHALNACLVFLLFLRLTRVWLWSALIAAIFAFHPIQVESVAWVTERKDVLSLFFGLLTLLAYLRFLNAKTPGNHILMIGVFILSLLSKPMMVTLPAVMLLLDGWPLKRLAGAENKFKLLQDLLVEKWVLFALSLGMFLLTYQSMHTQVSKPNLAFLFSEYPHAYLWYLVKYFHPVNLLMNYPVQRSIPVWEVILNFVLILSLFWICVQKRRAYPCLLSGLIWYSMTLFPAIPMPVSARFSYLPMVGIVWAVTGLVVLDGPIRKFLGNFLGTISVSYLMILSFLTWHQIGYWKDDETLFTQAVQEDPANWLAYDSLGKIYSVKQNREKAIECYEHSLIPNPMGPFRVYAVYSSRKTDELQDFARFIKKYGIDPLFGDAYYNVGVKKLQMKEAGDALAYFSIARLFEEKRLDSTLRLAEIFEKQNRWVEAEQNYRFALQMKPDAVNLYVRLSEVLLGQGRRDEAREIVRRGLKVDAQDDKLNRLIRELDKR